MNCTMSEFNDTEKELRLRLLDVITLTKFPKRKDFHILTKIRVTVI